MIKSRRIIWERNAIRMEERKGVHRGFTGKPEGKVPLGRQSVRREYNIKMDNTYAVQQDTQSVLMSEFIHHVC